MLLISKYLINILWQSLQADDWSLNVVSEKYQQWLVIRALDALVLLTSKPLEHKFSHNEGFIINIQLFYANIYPKILSQKKKKMNSCHYHV